MIYSVIFSFYSGTEKDLHDSNVEYKQLNCAEAKSKAPPASSPPPVSAPFTDTRIGCTWHTETQPWLTSSAQVPVIHPVRASLASIITTHITQPLKSTPRQFLPALPQFPAPVSVPAPAPTYYPFPAPVNTYMVN